MAKNPKTKEKKETKHGSGIGTRVLHGRIVTVKVLRRYSGLLILVILFCVGYIANKFMCQTDLATIKSLKTELARVKSDYVNASSTYYSRIREGEMRTLVDSLHLDLRSPEKPPYKIED